MRLKPFPSFIDLFITSERTDIGGSLGWQIWFMIGGNMVKTKVLLFVALMLIIPELILAVEKTNITSAKYDQHGYPVRNVPTVKIRNLLINRNFNELNKLLDGYQKEFEKDFRHEYISP